MQPKPKPVAAPVTLHLLVVANSLDVSIGPGCEVDRRKLKTEFANIAEALGIQFKSYEVEGKAFAKGQVLAMLDAFQKSIEEDSDAVEQGGTVKSRIKGDYRQFPPAKVDRRLKDGEEVKMGGSTVVAHLTPGHTRGCTTWTMKVNDLNAVIIGSPNVNPGYILVGNKDYPGIAEDYERCFRVLKSLPVDLFLGAHGGYYDMNAKHQKFLVAGGTNPFIDPEGYRAYVEDREKAFRTELKKQQGK